VWFGPKIGDARNAQQQQLKNHECNIAAKNSALAQILRELHQEWARNWMICGAEKEEIWKNYRMLAIHLGKPARTFHVGMAR
jgi:aminopeptidase C